jgi:hypothetical protein
MALLLQGEVRQSGVLLLLLPGPNVVTVDRDQGVIEWVLRVQDHEPQVVALVGGESG